MLFGIENSEKSIAQLGYRRYGNALSMFYRALESDRPSQSLNLLGAGQIMVLVEFLVSDHQDGWITHSRGLEKLLDRQTPESIVSLPFLRILERTRPTLVFAAIVLHQPTIFSRQEWKAQPWLRNPNRIDSLKLLFDIIADCADLFVLRDQIRSMSRGFRMDTAIQSLLAKCHWVLRGLEGWEQEWASTACYKRSEVPTPPSPHDLEMSNHLSTPIWPTVLQYPSQVAANAITIYNGALILVMRLMKGLSLEAGDTLSCEDLQCRVHAAGVAICRRIEFQLDLQRDGHDSFSLLFPLRMAYSAIGETDSVIGAWLKSVLDHI